MLTSFLRNSMKKTLLSTVVASILLVGCGGGGSSNPVEDNINNSGQTPNNGNNNPTPPPTNENGNTNGGDHILNGATIDIEEESSGGVQHREVKYTPYPLGNLTDGKTQYQNENSKTGRLVAPDYNIANPDSPQELLDMAQKFNGIPVNNISFTSPINTRHSGFLNTDLFYFDPYKPKDYDSKALQSYFDELDKYKVAYSEWLKAKKEDPTNDTAEPKLPKLDPTYYAFSDMIQMKAYFSSVTGTLTTKSTPTIKANGNYDYTNRGVAFMYVPSRHAYYVINNASNNLQDNLVTKPKIEQQVLNYQDENGIWKTEILVTVQNENSENTKNRFTKNGESDPSNSLKQTYIYEMVDLTNADSTAHVYANFPSNYAYTELLRSRIKGQICDLATAQKRYCFPANSLAYRLKASYTPEFFLGTTVKRSELSIADLMLDWKNRFIYDESTKTASTENFAFTAHFKDSYKTSNSRLIYLDKKGSIDSDSGLLDIKTPMKDHIVFSYDYKLYNGSYRPNYSYNFNIDENGKDCTVNSDLQKCSFIDHYDMSGRFLGSRWIYNETAYLQLKHQIDDNIGD